MAKHKTDYVAWLGIGLVLLGSIVAYATTVRVNCREIEHNTDAICKVEENVDELSDGVAEIRRTTDRLELLLDILKIPKQESKK